MANLGDLKARIVLETEREDIDTGGESEAALTTAIERAIEFYADEPFWFNQDDATVSTTSGTGYVAAPYAIRVVELVSYNGSALTQMPLNKIRHLTNTGQPRQWAESGGRIYLHPIPDATYSLSVYGVAQIDAPEDDEDETVWTNEAYDLIAARVRFLLYRDIWRDVEGTQLAAQAEGEALSRLRRESRKRDRSPLRSDVPLLRSGFDITQG